MQLREQRIAWLVGVVAFLSSACALPDQFRGNAGPVTWEVADIGQVTSRDNQRFRWSYTIVFRVSVFRGFPPGVFQPDSPTP